MAYINYVVGFSLAISILVFIHELGHYLAAVGLGVKVKEFSIGFGKTLLSRKSKNGTLWQIKALPIGGYVKMQGDDDGSSFKIERNKNIRHSSRGHSLQDKSHFAKILISLSGPAANYLFAVVAFSVCIFVFGRQVGKTNIIGFFSNNAPAVLAGLKIGDKITAVDGRAVNNIKDVQKYTAISGGKTIQVTFLREGKSETTAVKPVLISSISDSKDDDEKGRYIIGIKTPPYYTKEVSLAKSITLACKEVATITIDSASAIKKIITTWNGASNLSGPVRIAVFSGSAIQGGVKSFLTFLGVLSVGLGFFNLLPLPMLDGGQTVFWGIELIIGRPLPLVCYKIFQALGTITIALIFAIVFFNDIRALLSK